MFQQQLFGERLKKLRLENRVSQQQIADLLHVTRTQVSDMENGKTGTTMVRLVLLAEFYHVSTDYLLGITDDPAWRGK